jgi:predicted deacylase
MVDKKPLSIGSIKSILSDSSINGTLLYKHFLITDKKQKVKVPVVIVKGISQGPVMGILCMQHGTEINGMEVMRRTLNKINPNTMSGSMVVVTTTNPLAAAAKKQSWPTDANWDTNRPACDMNRIWPGNPNGSITARIADRVYKEVVGNVDYMIDIHSHEPCYSPATIPQNTKQSLNFSLAAGIVLNKPSPFKKKPGQRWTSGDVIDRKAGIPYCCLELPPLRLFSEEGIRIGEQAVRNALVYTRITKGKPVLPKQQIIVNQNSMVTTYRSSMNGILVKHKQSGDTVKKGELIGEVFSFEGLDISQKIISKCSEESAIFVLGRETLLTEHETDTVQKGEVICRTTRDFNKVINK